MLDAALRPLIGPPLDAAGRALARRGVSATTVTLVGLGVSLATVAALAAGRFGAALALLALSRLLDGLDGAVARASAPTDAGGYLDSVCDYVFYAGVPLGFALAAPAANALPAAALLASFLLTCSSFLAWAALAARRGLETTARGRKSFFYSGGLVEGTETIAAFVAMCLLPERFPALAWAFAAACVATALLRSAAAWREFR
jgi:phosphatidylglycerophosphate synthase